MPDLFDPLTFSRGPTMKNRFMLAPLTNSQSFDDGRLSDDEFNWLTMRARGGFGHTMTCAAHVQPTGQGFPGQLGIYSDDHLQGLTRLASAIGDADSVSSVQLHHAGMQSPVDLISGPPLCPSDDAESGARGLSGVEVAELVEDFVAAACRAEQAGFDGVELHGAHRYILCQFLSPEINRRDDDYGGSPENRARIIFEIIDGIRARCGADFQLGIRLSPERFGVHLPEIIALTAKLMDDDAVDYIDMSLWDVFKEPEDAAFRGRSLMSCFTELARGNVRLGVAGKIRSGEDARRCLDAGCDFVLIGRAAILHHDFPDIIKADAGFRAVDLPVTADYLRGEGLGESFVEYLGSWDDFVEG